MLSRNEQRDTANTAYQQAIKSGFSSHHLEDIDKYIDRFREVIKFFNNIPNTEKIEMDHVRLAVCYDKLADAYAAAMKVNKTLHILVNYQHKMRAMEYAKAIKMGERPLPKNPADDDCRQIADYYFELAYEYAQLSHPEYELDEEGALARCYRDAIRQYLKAAEALKMMSVLTDVAYRRMARIYKDIALICVNQAGRVEAYGNILAALIRIKDKTADDVLNIGKYHIKMGDELVVMNDLPQAIHSYQAPLQIANSLHEESLVMVLHVVNAACESKLGSIYLGLNDYQTAKRHFKNAVNEFEKSLASSSSATWSSNDRKTMSVYESSLAFAHAAMQHQRRAAKHYHKAIDIRSVGNIAEFDDKDLVNLANLHVNLIDVYKIRNNKIKVIAEYAESIRLMQALDRKTERTHCTLAVLYQESGDVLVSLARMEEAAAQYDKAINELDKYIDLHLPDLVEKIIRGYSKTMVRSNPGKLSDNETRLWSHQHSQLSFLNSRLTHPLDHSDQAEVIRHYKIAISLLNSIEKHTAEDYRQLAVLRSKLSTIYDNKGKQMRALEESAYALVNRISGKFSRKSKGTASPLQANSIYSPPIDKGGDTQKDRANGSSFDSSSRGLPTVVSRKSG